MTIGTSLIAEANVGDTLPGWTPRWGLASTPNVATVVEAGGNVGATSMNWPLGNDSVNSDTGPLASWDVFDEALFSTADTDILCLWKYDTAKANATFRLWTRGSGVESSENGYCLRMSGAADTVVISEASAGVVSDLVSTTQVFALETWYWWQFRVVGTSLQARWWEYGTAAPYSWTLDTTDGTHTAGGYVGVGHNNNSNTSYQIDYFNVGLDGEYAQLPPTDAAPTLPILRCSPAKVQVDADGFLNFIGEPNKAISWAITAGGGSIGVIDTATNDSGLARAVFDPGSPGTADTTTTIEVTYGT